MWNAARNTLLGRHRRGHPGILPIGTAGALLVNSLKGRSHLHCSTPRWLLRVLTPGAVIGISTLLFWYKFNVPAGLHLSVLGRVSFIAAYVMLMVLARLQSFDGALEEAYLLSTQGASHSQMLRRVLLPHLYPALGAGAVLAFFQSVENFQHHAVHPRLIHDADRLCGLKGAVRHHAVHQRAGDDHDHDYRHCGARAGNQTPPRPGEGGGALACCENQEYRGTFTNRFVGFTRLTAEDGSQGWGQVSTYNSDLTCEVLHRQVAPYALGRDTDDLDDILATSGEKEHKFPGSYLRRAMTGLDTAVWDWRGKRPANRWFRCWAARPASCGPMRSSMKRDITPEDEDRPSAFSSCATRKALMPSSGKRVGAETGRDTDEWEGRTEKIVPYVSKALGDGIDKLVDANSCYSPKKAIEVGRMLEANGIGHYEEPCPYWEFRVGPEGQSPTRSMSM